MERSKVSFLNEVVFMRNVNALKCYVTKPYIFQLCM